MTNEEFTRTMVALSQACAIESEILHENLVALKPNLQERLYVQLNGVSFEGVPILEFKSVGIVLPPFKTSMLHAFSRNFVERNYFTVDAFWGCLLDAHRNVLRVFGRMSAGHLTQIRFQRTIAAVLNERKFFQDSFVRNGGLIITPLSADPQWREGGHRAERREEIAPFQKPIAGREADGKELEFVPFISAIAEASGLSAFLYEPGVVCVALGSHEMKVTVFITPREYVPGGDLIVEFSSVAKPLPHDADLIEQIAYKLLRRNAETYNARWAFQIQENTYFLKVIRNIFAGELDPDTFSEVIGSFVQEFRFSFELGEIGNTLWPK
jgi:hypothetical protein